MSIHEKLELILFGKNLVDKLTPVLFSNDLIQLDWKNLPSFPGRNNKLIITNDRVKFPKKDALKDTEQRAKVFNFFANHELQAIEMMAAALLFYPNDNKYINFKKAILGSLSDEQKHLSLYVKKMNEWGYEFGDWPINSFFWNYMEKIKTPESYLSAMSLTFESANLDFAQRYKNIFEEMGDLEAADIMNQVLVDEIGHVAIGPYFFKQWFDPNDLWKIYMDFLPLPLTPARSKGHEVNKEARLMAGIDSGFIDNLISFNDNYLVTMRKEWKK